MIAAIDGIVVKQDAQKCIIKTECGLSFVVFVSLNTLSVLHQNQKVELFTTQIVREDANLLYGFSQEAEKKMFDMLIKLSGIGPSTAIAICSSITAQKFALAISQGDLSVLTSIPGIGPKTAKRMLVELGDAKLMFDDVKSYQNDAMLALESLGFKRDKINKVLLDCSADNAPELIKEALKKLGRN